MFQDLNQQKRFFTLIASPSCSVLKESQLADLQDIALIYTHTDVDTVSAVACQLFNLILLDLDLRGLDVLSITKNSKCINCNTPIIGLTDTLKPHQRKLLISAGFDDCLIKPLSQNQIIEAITFWREDESMAPYLDSIKTLLSKTKNNTRLVNTLYNKLFEELPMQISNIEEAIEKGDYKFAFDVTHSLNGSAKTCYLREIAENANALETCLIQKKFYYVDGFLMILKQKVSTFIEHREAILAFLNDGR